MSPSARSRAIAPTILTLIRPCGPPSPWKGEGFIRSDASFPSPCVGILQASPAAMPAPFNKGAYLSSTSAPLVKGGTPPKAEGGFRTPHLAKFYIICYDLFKRCQWR